MSGISDESKSPPHKNFKDSTWQSFYAMPVTSLNHPGRSATIGLTRNHIEHGNSLRERERERKRDGGQCFKILSSFARDCLHYIPQSVIYKMLTMYKNG